MFYIRPETRHAFCNSWTSTRSTSIITVNAFFILYELIGFFTAFSTSVQSYFIVTIFTFVTLVRIRTEATVARRIAFSANSSCFINVAAYCIAIWDTLLLSFFNFCKEQLVRATCAIGLKRSFACFTRLVASSAFVLAFKIVITVRAACLYLKIS